MKQESLRFEIKDGDLSWPEVLPMRERVYPASNGSTDLLSSIEWSNAKNRVLLYSGDILVSVTGFYERDILLDDRKTHIAGIGGVMTDPAFQGHGFGKKIVNQAIDIFKSENRYAFAYLFCEDHNIAFYETLDWKLFEGDVSVEQNGKSGPMPMRNSMFYPLNDKINPRAKLDLCGLPW